MCGRRERNYQTAKQIQSIVRQVVMVDFLQLTAERVHKVPKGWKWCKVDSHNKPDDFIEMQGAVTVGEYKSGPRKGRPKWPKELQTIWMRRSEIDRVAIEWEIEEGKCQKCYGAGQESVGWSKAEGTRYRKCQRCNGSGLPPA